MLWADSLWLILSFMPREMDFRRMRAYVLAREFYSVVIQHERTVRHADAQLVDQLVRASSSICLNIAEGAGEFSRPEKNRFYRIARRSAWETSAAVDLLSLRISCTPLLESTEKLDQVSALLTTMILRPPR